MVVIADASKKVAVLGAFPLPVEVVPFGLGSTQLRLERVCAALGLDGAITLRRRGRRRHSSPTAATISSIARSVRFPIAERLAAHLAAMPGVVEHGLFLGLASVALIAGPAGVETAALSGALQ